MPEAAYAARIAAIGRELGIPADYGRVRGLPLMEEAAETVVIGTNPDGREVRLTPAAAAAWTALSASAASAGRTFLTLSGFRGVARQSELVREKLAQGESIAAILTRLAAPGFSEHHTGRAIDLGSAGQAPLTEEFETTAEFAWLGASAARFGFRLSYPKENPHGIIYEPWHWCFHDPAKISK